ncbi:MAG: CBS domain-containing protein, partial [Anaerolineae bacterium]
DDNRRPVGILEEHDIIRRAASDEAIFERRVGEVMKKDMVIGSPHDDLRMLAHTMTETRTRHVPILEDGELVGIVSIGDILKAERDTYMGEVDRLQIEMMGS